MYKYEIQFLGRDKGDFERHMEIAEKTHPAGKMGWKSYYFAGVKGLVVLLERKTDRDSIFSAVPRLQAASG